MLISTILFPGCHFVDHGNVSAVLSHSGDGPDRAAFEVESRSLDGGPVTTTEGPVLVPDRSDWRVVHPPQLVLLLTGHDPLGYLPMGLRGFLLQAAKGGATLCEVGSGNSVLAHLGLFRPEGPLRKTHEACQYLPETNCIVTGGGIALIEILQTWIACTCPIENAPVAACKALEKPDVDPVLQRMVVLMNARLERPVSIRQICERLAQSPKQLRLRCHRRMGRTPAQVYQDLRLAHARQLLEGGTMPVSDVAQAVGFASHSAFSRSYRRHFGTQPRHIRHMG